MARRAFDDIIDINELIKSINALSKRVRLEALNASLSARAVGEHGRGFVIVAQELQHFSELLGQSKKKQNDLYWSVIWLTAQHMSTNMRHRQLKRALQQTDKNDAFHYTCNQLNQRLTDLEQQISSHQRQMNKLIDDMEEYCKVGVAISNTALIEAAHCGSTEADLKKVAKVMGNAVNEIAGLLGKIKRINAIKRSGESNPL